MTNIDDKNLYHSLIHTQGVQHFVGNGSKD